MGVNGDREGCCNTVFWSARPCNILEPIRRYVQGFACPQRHYIESSSLMLGFGFCFKSICLRTAAIIGLWKPHIRELNHTSINVANIFYKPSMNPIATLFWDEGSKDFDSMVFKNIIGGLKAPQRQSKSLLVLTFDCMYIWFHVQRLPLGRLSPWWWNPQVRSNRCNACNCFDLYII